MWHAQGKSLFGLLFPLVHEQMGSSVCFSPPEASANGTDDGSLALPVLACLSSSAKPCGTPLSNSLSRNLVAQFVGLSFLSTLPIPLIPSSEDRYGPACVLVPARGLPHTHSGTAVAS